MAALELAEVSFHSVDGDEGEVPGDKKKAAAAVPGKPSFALYAAGK